MKVSISSFLEIINDFITTEDKAEYQKALNLALYKKYKHPNANIEDLFEMKDKILYFERIFLDTASDVYYKLQSEKVSDSFDYTQRSWTIPDFARHVGVSKANVYERSSTTCKKGKLMRRIVSGKARIFQVDYERWKENYDFTKGEQGSIKKVLAEPLKGRKK